MPPTVDDDTLRRWPRALFDRAAAPKRSVLVEGSSHHGASGTGLPEVRAAVQALFGLPGGDGKL